MVQIVYRAIYLDWAIKDLDIQFRFLKWAIKDLDIQFGYIKWAIKDLNDYFVIIFNSHIFHSFPRISTHLFRIFHACISHFLFPAPQYY